MMARLKELEAKLFTVQVLLYENRTCEVLKMTGETAKKYARQK